MPAADTAFSCTCGKLTGRLEKATARFGGHVECFCKDCRAVMIHLGQPDPRPGGVRVFQTLPDRVKITAGHEHLGLLRLGPKGLFRWYATCCNAPMFNTLTRPKLPFAGIIAARLENPGAIGPVRTRSFVPDPKTGRNRHHGAFPVFVGMLSRLVGARLSGRWRDTPFFDAETGQPVATPKVLSREERRQAEQG